jgi:hypothetical protein
MLDERQLLKIKDLLLKGNKITPISNLFGIAKSQVSLIKNGKSCHTEFLGGGLNDWLAEKNIQEK